MMQCLNEVEPHPPEALSSSVVVQDVVFGGADAEIWDTRCVLLTSLCVYLCVCVDMLMGFGAGQSADGADVVKERESCSLFY